MRRRRTTLRPASISPPASSHLRHPPDAPLIITVPNPACSIANTALQRTMGTIAGGIIGFLVRCIGDVLHTHFLALMYAATAAAIGGFGIWLGETVGGDDTGMWSTTAKLSVTTFLLVFADGKDPVRPLLERSASCLVLVVEGSLTLFVITTPDERGTEQGQS